MVYKGEELTKKFVIAELRKFANEVEEGDYPMDKDSHLLFHRAVELLEEKAESRKHCDTSRQECKDRKCFGL